jgi:hypothetical protein
VKKAPPRSVIDEERDPGQLPTRSLPQGPGPPHGDPRNPKPPVQIGSWFPIRDVGPG